MRRDVKKRIFAAFLCILVVLSTFLENSISVFAEEVGSYDPSSASIQWYDNYFSGATHGAVTLVPVVDGSNTYQSICTTPDLDWPSVGESYDGVGGWNYGDTISTILFYTIGSGAGKGGYLDAANTQWDGNPEPVTAYLAANPVPDPTNFGGEDHDYCRRAIIARLALISILEDTTVTATDQLPFTYARANFDAGFVDMLKELIDYAKGHWPYGYRYGSRVYVPSSDSSTSQTLYAYWEEPKGKIRLHKSSTETATESLGSYSFDGAEYSVYKTNNGGVLSDLVTTVTLNASGDGETELLELGTYYVRESAVPSNASYALSSQIYTVTLTNSSVTGATAEDLGYGIKSEFLNVSDSPVKTKIRIEKKSANESLTNSNSCYSLAGAKFKLWFGDTWESATLVTAGADGDGYYVTGADGVIEIPNLNLGTYWVKEYVAPDGYELYVGPDGKDYVKVDATSATTLSHTVTINEVPKNDPVSIFLKKQNSVTHQPVSGAIYTVKYYDTYSTTVPTGAPVRTWRFKTNDEGAIDLGDPQKVLECYVDGDALYYDSFGEVVFPYGTLTIEETQAPANYMLDTNIYVADTKNQKMYVNGVLQGLFWVDGTNTFTVNETPMYAKVKVTKTMEGRFSYLSYVSRLSAVSQRPEAQAEFEIYLKSSGSYEAASVETRDKITTDATGVAITKDLPMGTYVIHQSKGANNFTRVPDREVTLSVAGQVYSFGVSEGYVDKEQYSEIELIKKGDVLTGFDSTNGFIYEEKNVGGCVYGVYSDLACAHLIESITTSSSGAAKSAYLYKPGTYYVKEISSVEPFLIDTTVYSVVVNEFGDNTTTLFVASKTLRDERQNLNVSVTKKDGATGETLSNAKFSVRAGEDILGYDGSVLIASGSLIETITTDVTGKAEFTFNYPIGYKYDVTEVKAPIGYGNAGETKTADATGFNANIPTQNITLEFADTKTTLKTTAKDSLTNTNQGSLSENGIQKIVDTVALKDLVVGDSYKISGKLMNKKTNSEYLDVNGLAVTATKEFVATSKDMSVDIEFVFTGNIKDTTIVVFEDLYQKADGVYTEIVKHEDIGDVDQTVYYPSVKTTAKDKDTDSHSGVVSEVATIVDTVTYTNLLVGKKYLVKGVLYDRTNNTKLLDKNGNEITATKEFVAASANGSVDVVFTFDSNLVAGKSVVVFEDLYYNDVKIATHADINDDHQTVDYPKIGTQANDGVSGTKDNNGVEDVTIIDTVKYSNLTIGKEYVVKGVLMDKNTGKPIISKTTNKEITSEVKFTATKKDGEDVYVTFNLKREDLVNRTVVVFEDLFLDEIT